MNNLARLKIITISILLLSLTSCSLKEDNLETIKTGTNVTNRYDKKVFIEGNNHLDNPAGILYTNSMLYVVNKGSDTIGQYDSNGTFLKEIGKTGNGECEFISPVLIVTDPEGNFYIAEEGNARVQMFNKNFEYVKEYPIKQVDKFDCDLLDMEVDADKNIYLSFRTLKSKKARILIIEENGTNKLIGNDLNGIMGRDLQNDQIYYAQTYDYDKNSIYTGQSFLAKITDKKISKIEKLNSGHYGPSDLVVRDDIIYIFSCATHQVETFNLDGEYLETLYKGDVYDPKLDFYYITMNEDEEIYASNQKDNEIYIFTKQ